MLNVCRMNMKKNTKGIHVELGDLATQEVAGEPEVFLARDCVCIVVVLLVAPFVKKRDELKQDLKYLVSLEYLNLIKM